MTALFSAGVVGEHALSLVSPGDLALTTPAPGDLSALDADLLLNVARYIEYQLA